MLCVQVFCTIELNWQVKRKMYGSRGRRRDNEGGYGGGGYRDFGPSTAPVKVGDELEVSIEAVGEKGDGIAKKDGFVLFIPGVRQGDKVHIRVTKVLRKVGFAEVVGQGAPAEAPASAEEAPAEAAAEAESSDEAGETAGDTESFGEEEGEQ
jgi:predicted RNA-binding protein with TRAM domain